MILLKVASGNMLFYFRKLMQVISLILLRFPVKMINIYGYDFLSVILSGWLLTDTLYVNLSFP